LLTGLAQRFLGAPVLGDAAELVAVLLERRARSVAPLKQV
jgi:hypothetical protein